jgi:DNA-binding CsgD family transcriptional regulator
LVDDAEREAEGIFFYVSFADAPYPGALGRFRELLSIVKHPVSRHLCLTGIAIVEAQESGWTETTIDHFRGAADVLAGTPYRLLIGIAGGNLVQIYLHVGRTADAYDQATRASTALGEAGPETVAWIYAWRASAAVAVGQFGDAIASLKRAMSLARSSGPMGEVLIAATAVLAASDAPLLAARVWGAASAGTSNLALSDLDRIIAERSLASARRQADPTAFELAFMEGQRASLGELVEEIQSWLGEIAEGSAQNHARRLQHGTLTHREAEVLVLVAAGRTDAEIARHLFISPKTASVHVSNAKAKIGVETRLEMALWARERGLVGESGDS